MCSNDVGDSSIEKSAILPKPVEDLSLSGHIEELEEVQYIEKDEQNRHSELLSKISNCSSRRISSAEKIRKETNELLMSWSVPDHLREQMVNEILTTGFIFLIDDQGTNAQCTI